MGYYSDAKADNIEQWWEYKEAYSYARQKDDCKQNEAYSCYCGCESKFREIGYKGYEK